MTRDPVAAGGTAYIVYVHLAHSWLRPGRTGNGRGLRGRVTFVTGVVVLILRRGPSMSDEVARAAEFRLPRRWCGSSSRLRRREEPRPDPPAACGVGGLLDNAPVPPLVDDASRASVPVPPERHAGAEAAIGATRSTCWVQSDELLLGRGKKA